MASQYALSGRPTLAGGGGAPAVSPSSRAAHAILDTSVAEFAAKNFPQYASMIPEKYAKMTVREAYKGANFMEKQMFASKLAGALPKGVTMADVEKAVNEPAPPPETKPAAPPAQAPPQAPASPAAQPLPAPATPRPSPVSAPTPAPAAPVVVAPSSSAPPAPPAAATAPAGQYSFPQASPASRGPTTGAAAALPQGNAPLDYLAQYGGHATVMREGKKVNVHPGTAGNYGALNSELAGRLHAAGQAYEKETGKKPSYGEASRGEDVQKTYWEESGHGTKYAAAPPGRSQHQKGGAMDLPAGEFRDWLYAGNKSRFGLHFPVKNDAPHVQADPAFKGTFANARTGGAAPGTPQPDVQAGAGPAAVAAARAADTAPRATGGAMFPPGTAPETQAAINSLASRLGVSPAAIAGVIKTESNWNPNAVSPGGGYKGLTQIGPDTFKEAGGKLGGLTYDEFLKATPAQQVAAYGGYLDHYKFSDTAKAKGVDFSKMSPAQQAAHLQAFQFSPAVSDWQGGDPNKPVTTTKQAPALGTTSLADMTKYYEGLLKNSSSEYPDPTPGVGGGQEYYDNKTPDTSTSVASSSASDSAPSVSAAAAPDSGFGKDFGGGLGDAFDGIAKAFSGGGGAARLPSTPANATAPQMTTPSGPLPLVDPRVAENQRQMLALAMQRLNSGKLF